MKAKNRLTIKEIQELPLEAFPVEVECDDGYWVHRLKEIKILSPHVTAGGAIAVDIDNCIEAMSESDLYHYPSFKQPEEETYTLLELKEGFEYSCDESIDGDKFKRTGFSVVFVASDGEEIELGSIYKYKTFRKIKKELKFSDLEVGEKYIEAGEEQEFLMIHGDLAIFFMPLHDQANAYTENEIANWERVMK